MNRFFLLLLIPFVSSLKLSRRSGDCTSSNKCTRCQGHCTDDTQCGEVSKTLKCYKRGNAMNQVPGCEVGEPAAAGSTIYNYCYEVCPTGTELSTEVGGVGCKGKIASVLKAAPGSCDGTQDGSLDIWVNTAVAANEIYDILSSNFKVAKIEAGDGTIDTLRTTTLAFTTMTGKINGVTNINANSIGPGQIAGKAITTAKLDDGAVTRDKIGAGVVNGPKIDPGTIVTINTIKLTNRLHVGSHAHDNNWRFKSVYNAAFYGRVYTGGQLDVKGEIVAHQLIWVKAPHLYSYFAGSAQVLASYKSATFTGVFQANNNKHKFSIYAEGIIYSNTYVAASDERIKENIQPIADFEALKIIRKLDAKSYEYKDKYERGWNRTFGFIAQDVQKHIPEAVKQVSKEIPSIYDLVEVSFFKQGNQYNMKLLNRVLEPGKYAFYVSTIDNNATTVKSEYMTTEDGISFISNSTYDEVLLRGPYVDDFLTIDKDKIFSVAYAALQQVDKNQITLQKKVASLEETIASLTERLATLEAK